MDSTSQATPVVGIGISAGGIEALEELFRSMPERPGLVIVIVAHLAPDRDSALPEIVGRLTPMPVAAARDGLEVRADHVYVVPPASILTLAGGRLRVRPSGPLDRERNPIDAFLGSLGEDLGERAIAVILSGSGSDGTLGLKVVKEAGGLTVAQGSDGTAPRYAGMADSAIASGLVDLVLPAEAIPAKLAEYVRSFGVLDGMMAAEDRPSAAGAPSGDAAGGGGADGPRQAICAILRDRVGHDFSGYKRRTFLRRVQRRMQVLQLPGADAYVARLREDPDEVTRLFRDLLIGVTGFFRDAEAFEALERAVVPSLLEGKGASDTVRVWVPGCSTGEEVYSIAIAIRERLDELGTAPRVQLFATDIDEAALDVARAARYPAALLQGMDPARARRFFAEEGGTYTLSRRVRDMCVFSPHSVIRDPPFRRLDLVSCRNLLIYLGAELQQQVIPVFHYALRPGGYLFLGSAENVSQHADLFAPVDKKSRIFRRQDHAESAVRLPLFLSGRGAMALPGLEARAEAPAVGGATLRRAVEAEVLERFAPAHVVVNRDGDAIYHSARTGKYLELPAGTPSRQLLPMARKGLRLDLRSALQEAVETRRAAERRRIAVEVDDGHVQVVDLTVSPLARDRGGEPLYLVLFADVGALLSPADAAARDRPPDGDPALERLERDLRDTRERLQSTIEEYETALEELKAANEELVALNEELQSTNEELETSKEEIQSVNEELHTVNQELGANVDQLNHANTDLRHLFESTGIATVFLDKRLVIRSFTPAVTELFNLIPTDRGRPFADIAGHLDHPALHADLEAVLASGRPLERQASRRDGARHYLVRLLPYRADGAAPDGVVATFVDITGMVEAERRQGTLIDELNQRVRTMLAAVTAIAGRMVERTPGMEAFAEAFTGRVLALSRAYGLLARERWADVPLDELARGQLDAHAAGGADPPRYAAEGPPVLLRARAAVALGMVLHELATNAVRHGALSAPGGRVALEWRTEERRDGRRLVLAWTERGGPPAREPAAGGGLGSELIRHELEDELGGELTVEFRPEGLALRAVVPWRPGLLA